MTPMKITCQGEFLWDMFYPQCESKVIAHFPQHLQFTVTSTSPETTLLYSTWSPMDRSTEHFLNRLWDTYGHTYNCYNVFH